MLLLPKRKVQCLCCFYAWSWLRASHRKTDYACWNKISSSKCFGCFHVLEEWVNTSSVLCVTWLWNFWCGSRNFAVSSVPVDPQPNVISQSWEKNWNGWSYSPDNSLSSEQYYRETYNGDTKLVLFLQWKNNVHISISFKNSSEESHPWICDSSSILVSVLFSERLCLVNDGDKYILCLWLKPVQSE